MISSVYLICMAFGKLKSDGMVLIPLLITDILMTYMVSGGTS